MQYTKYYLHICILFVVSEVDKCAPVRYNVSTFKKEVYMMMALAFAKSSYCSTFAAAYTSAPNMEKLDTAPVAVSILRFSIICKSYS